MADGGASSGAGPAQKRDDDCIQVVVRCRPLNRKELEEKRGSIVDIDMELRQVTIANPNGNKDDSKSFTFDSVYDDKTIQRTFYEESCFNLVESVLEGFNGTIFAYGQTGCGKSWTMQGPSSLAQPELRGVIPNAFAHIFESVKATNDVEFLIRCSYLEIYNEEIKDLLGNAKTPTKCEVKEDPQKGVFIKNLTDVVVESEQDMTNALERGLQYRTTAATQMNEQSSRSHSIFTIVVEMSTKDPTTGKEMLRAGKLNLVDLAGSERQKKTGAEGALLKEGAKINLSLSALGNVISALSEGKPGKHVPYRDSKLTRLLQDSLGGNTKTLMVAAISPADYNYDETTSTLRYANRAKNIKNKPKINEDPKDTMLREFKAEIENLKKMLASQASGVPISAPGPDGSSTTTMVAAASASAEVVERAGHNSEKVRTLEQEKERANEQLREKESEIERERQMREELNARLLQLQSKFVGHADTTTGDGEAKPTESPEEAAERAEAAKRLKERRAKAKAKRAARTAAEIARIKQEKEALEDELKELALGKEVGEADKEAMDKKISKMRRKYEKRVQAVRQESDDMREEAVYQYQQLLEAFREKEKETKLYEAVCRSLAGEKELKRILNKSRYNEDDDTWVLPFTKRKSFDEHQQPLSTSSSNGSFGMGGGGGSVASMNECIRMGPSSSSSSSSSGNGGGSDMLPSVTGIRGVRALGGGGGGNSGGELPSVMGARGVRQQHKQLDVGSSSISLGAMHEDDMITFKGAGGFLPGGGIEYVPGMDDYSSFARTQQLPNTIVQQSSYGGGGGGDDEDQERERERRARKKQQKAEKLAKQQQQLEAQQQAQQDAQGLLENGSGVTAGPLTDWGWANEQAQSAAILSGQHSGDEPEYSDDFEVEHAGGKSKGKGSAAGSRGMPPIGADKGKQGSKQGQDASKKKGGGFSLPSI